MIIAQFTSANPEMGQTRTYESFYKFLGAKPHKLGVISRMYPKYTATYITESLRNIVYRSANAKDKYQSIDAMYFEWESEVNFIKRVEFAAQPTDTGENGSEITFAFKERYYEKYDIFKIEASEQQVIVLYQPTRKADDYWEVVGRLIDNDYASILDLDACLPGMTTRFQSVAMPELHEEGYTKYQSNIEKHRNYITTHRVDVNYSALYAAHEDTFIKISEGKDKTCLHDSIYKMNKKEKDLLDNFMYVRNNGLLFNKCNVDANGKATISDPDTGRPIYIGDGIIPQVERFASKYAFSKLTVEIFNTVIGMLCEKSDKPVGNHFVFIGNDRMHALWNQTLAKYLADFKTDGSYLYSKAKNGDVQVGATFTSYEFMGNTISFTVDRTFSHEKGYDKAYAVCLDLTGDEIQNTPAISMFTLKGGDFISNRFLGVGREDGLSSGDVSSPVAGSRLINWGYSGVGVFCPYKSFILREI